MKLKKLLLSLALPALLASTQWGQVRNTTLYGSLTVTPGPINGPLQDFGAVGDGVTDDTAAIQAAINAATAGAVLSCQTGQTFKVTSTITIAKALTLAGGCTFLEVNAGSSDIFSITASGVTIEGFTISGQTPTTWDPVTPCAGCYSGIAADGNFAIVIAGGTSGHVFRGLTISNKVNAIGSRNTGGGGVSNVLIEGNIISGVKRGVGFLMNDVSGATDTNANINVRGNTITCSHGSLYFSRPIVIFNQRNSTLSENYGVGGGMSLESYWTAAYWAAFSEPTLFFPQNVKVANNTFDATISGGDVIDGNTLDGSLAPSGRGIQAGVYEAIEPFLGGEVTGNLVENMPPNADGVLGIAGVYIGVTSISVVGNHFRNLQAQSATASGSQNCAVLVSSEFSSSFPGLNRVLVKGVNITGNTMDNVPCGVGVALGSGGYQSNQVLIEANHMRTLNAWAVRLYNIDRAKIAGNTIEDCWTVNTSGSSTTANAIELRSSDKTQIQANTLRNVTAGQGFAYAIYANSGITELSVLDNEIFAPLNITPFSITSTPLLMSGNIVSENSGSVASVIANACASGWAWTKDGSGAYSALYMCAPTTVASGSLTLAGSFNTTVRTVSSSDTATTSDHTLIITSAITETLPAAPNAGQELFLVTGAAATLAGNGNQIWSAGTLSSSLSLSANSTAILQFDANVSVWRQIK